MDFLDPKKKRAHQQRLFIGYILVGAALLIGAYVIVMQAYGFGVDRKTGEVVQNGLLFVDAHPVAAEVTLNGVNKGKTDKRLILPEGKYDMELNSEGYRTWKRSFSLEGGKVERFVYPFLFPTEMVSADSVLYGSIPTMASQSPDRKWLIIQQPGNLTSLDVVDLSDPKTTPVVTQALPNNLLSTKGANHSLTPVEWSTDNRHVLLKHSFEGGVEFVVFDRQTPGQSFNVNQTFAGVQFSDVVLKDKKVDQLYLHDTASSNLLLGQVGSKQTTLLISRVLAFKPHGEKEILYVTDDNAQQGKVNVRLQQNGDTYNIRELNAGTKYLIDIARFEGSWFLVAGSTAESKAYVYKNPQAFLKRTQDRPATPIYVLKADNAAFVSFSANTRFIALQAGTNFNVYDAENDRGFRFASALPIAIDKQAVWMDGHRLMVISSDKVEVFDYDGTNQQALVSAYSSFVPFFDRDYKNLYTLSPSTVVEGRPALINTQIRLQE